MELQEKIDAIHEDLGEIKADIKWLVKGADTRRSILMWTGIIGVPIFITCLGIGISCFRDVEILSALHKPQMDIFRKGGDIIDTYTPTEELAPFKGGGQQSDIYKKKGR